MLSLIGIAQNLSNGLNSISLKVGDEAITILFEDLGDCTGGIITHYDYEYYIPMSVSNA